MSDSPHGASPRTALRSRRLAPALGLSLGLLSCIPSLSPLYTERDLVVDPALVGTWAGEDAEETWTFAAGEGKSYRLVIRGEGKSAVLDAHLLLLGGHRFLDLYPDLDQLAAAALGPYYELSLVPAHLFLRVGELGPGLELALLDADWLDELLKRRPRALDHRRIADGGIVITASTRELQRFVLRHVDDPGAFGEPSRLTRRASGP